MPATKINYGADSEWSHEAEAMAWRARQAALRFDKIEGMEAGGNPSAALKELELAEYHLRSAARHAAALRERFAEQYGLDDAHLTATIRSVGSVGR